ncbi:MAG: lysine--tRNA ligase, partial [Chlamydiia bacterium]|nr:lysine--tRNA ligase [Chlamydiia bacterium]
PEFTMLEAYASCWDYEDLMVCVENLFEYLAKELYGTTKIPALHPKDGTPIEIDLKAPWKRMTMAGSLQKYADLNFEEMTDEECREKLLETEEYAPAELAEMTRGMLLVELFESFVEQHLVQPHHIFDHPIETTPLCKPHRAEEQKKKGIIERFESFILGSEMCNAYSELNDPVLQRDLMLAQAEKRLAGEEGDKGEIPPVDEEFLEAVAQGMPPAGGLGIGVDRLVMLLTQAHSIRDVLFFPMMKPQNE